MTDENLSPPHYKRGRRLTHHPMIVRRLHLLVSHRGVIVNAVLTPGNWDDRDAATALVQAVGSGSVGLGDRGYRRPSVQDEGNKQKEIDNSISSNYKNAHSRVHVKPKQSLRLELPT